MSEVVQQVALRRSALHEEHEQAGARFIERDGWLLPAAYGNAIAEYNIMRAGDAASAGVIDLSSRGRIRVSGAEAVMFLNGLITNDVKALAPNAWMPAAFPNAQGRLLAFARVLRDSGGNFLFDTEAAAHERVLKTLERFTLAGDFRVADVTHETALLSVQGAGAAKIVSHILDDSIAALDRTGLAVAAPEWSFRSLMVLRVTHTAEDGFDLIVDAKEALPLWRALIDAGARPVGDEAFETLRIEAGIPRFGIDMDETNVVTEAVADDAVSYQKGCYIGQEIIARIHWRGHVAKKLTGLIFDDHKALLAPAAKIKSTDGKEIGRITSQAFSPRLSKLIALGYVKYDYLAPDTLVQIIDGDETRTARVGALPLVRGSWRE